MASTCDARYQILSLAPRLQVVYMKNSLALSGSLLIHCYCKYRYWAHTHTHLGVPRFGLSPEQLECAGVFSLDPPGWHNEVSIGLCYHHQVCPLNDAPLDTLDRFWHQR